MDYNGSLISTLLYSINGYKGRTLHRLIVGKNNKSNLIDIQKINLHYIYPQQINK